jgi:leucine dehydrogenase
MYELYGKMLDHLDGSYITAGDIGIVDQDLVELKKYTSYVCSTKGTDSGQSTAYGVFNAILGYNEFKYDSSSIENKKIVLKGFGKVGSRLAHFCKEVGAIVEVVDFESNRSLIENAGFKFLSKYQNTSFDSIDIFSPCATGGDLNTEFIEFANSVNIDCVIGAANNQLENNTIEKNLFDMGITFCPDYCVNAGGVIILALRSSIKEDMEYLDTDAKNKLIGIKNQLIKILTLSKEKNQLTTVSSNELAEAGFQ